MILAELVRTNKRDMSKSLDGKASLPVSLLVKLEGYRARHVDDDFVDAVKALIESRPDCFERTCFEPGHVTGSALLVSADRSRVLMNHHAALDIWIGFGGHADGEVDIEAVACRETKEESGLNVHPVFASIFDIDIHEIDPRPSKGEPAHLHFDIRYLLCVVGGHDFRVSGESKDMRWCSFDEAWQLTQDASMRRLLLKWKRLTLPTRPAQPA